MTFDQFRDKWSSLLSLSVIGGIARLAHSPALMFTLGSTTSNTGRVLTRPFTRSLSMEAGMLRPRKDDKVFNSIICLVVVDMMHYFMGQKIPAKMSLHNKTVLFNVSIVSLGVFRSIHKYVAFPIYSFATLPIGVINSATIKTRTGVRTKLLRMRFIISKNLRTLQTGIATLSRFVIADTTTKTGLLTGRCLEVRTALFAGVNHITIIPVPMYGGNHV